MLEVMYELSKYIPPSPNRVEGVELDLVDAEHVLCIEFDDRGEYKDVSYEQFDKSYPQKYLFKQRASNPPTYTPSLYLTETEKTLKHLTTIISNLLEDSEDKLIQGIYDEYEKNKEKIFSSIENHRSKLREGKILITLKIGGKYLREVPNFVDALVASLKNNNRYLATKGKGVCSMCGEVKEVYGDNSPYAFYTLDKPGYIVGGMREDISWKNFPLCFECRSKLDAVRNYIEQKLTFSFAGNIEYHMIPYFFTDNVTFIKSVLETISGSRKDVSVDRESYRNLTSDEREVHTIAQILNEQNVFSVTLMFLEVQQARETVRLLIQDVYPSRLKEIFDKKGEVDRWMEKIMSIGLDEISENYRKFMNALYVNTNNLMNFFTSRYNEVQSSDRFPFKKEFYKIVESIFKSVPFDEKSLIRIYMLSLRKLFNDPKRVDNFYLLVLQSYFLYVFVKLCVEGGNLMSQFSNLDDFLNSLKGLGDNPVAKGIFLTGVLAQRVLDYQEDQVGTRAFSSKLGGLILNKRDIMRILSQARNKLYEYDEFKPVDRIIFEKASELLSSSDDWKMNIDEISYYFSLGLGMKRRVYDFIFSLIKKENKEE